MSCNFFDADFQPVKLAVRSRFFAFRARKFTVRGRIAFGLNCNDKARPRIQALKNKRVPAKRAEFQRQGCARDHRLFPGAVVIYFTLLSRMVLARILFPCHSGVTFREYRKR